MVDDDLEFEETRSLEGSRAMEGSVVGENSRVGDKLPPIQDLPQQEEEVEIYNYKSVLNTE